MNGITEWDDDYARLARATTQLRASSNNSHNALSAGTRDNQISSLKSGVSRLSGQLRQIEQSRSVNPSEIARRRNLVDNLGRQVDTMGGGSGMGAASMGGSSAGYAGAGGYGNMSQAQMALRQQDDMLDELAVGVGRLKDQSKMINEEAKIHSKLLDDMDDDVEKAHYGMENETRRAMSLKENQSVW
eukprot:CAMPEP_0172497750 /NCGR_PEP_ID=MMETSP1066-20121228/104551_1 /TAXON_ID=671091 /ORGANISM="Coscinodiscus wailesii, Strain CCMP2513" /LENGTH=186 /DNA_ID=CAMNT_0013270695 /DNA_START=185 /DNA_END=742 /DNA_ORIENTATION=-